MKYYLVSYSHATGSAWGFGNIFFKCDPALAIKDAERTIAEETDNQGIVIIAINEISKGQYERDNGDI